MNQEKSFPHTMQDVYGSAAEPYTNHPAIFTAQTELIPQGFSETFEKNRVLGIESIENTALDQGMENEYKENAMNLLENIDKEMREKTSRLTENVLFHAQKELEVILQVTNYLSNLNKF